MVFGLGAGHTEESVERQGVVELLDNSVVALLYLCGELESLVIRVEECRGVKGVKGADLTDLVECGGTYVEELLKLCGQTEGSKPSDAVHIVLCKVVGVEDVKGIVRLSPGGYEHIELARGGIVVETGGDEAVYVENLCLVGVDALLSPICRNFRKLIVQSEHIIEFRHSVSYNGGLDHLAVRKGEILDERLLGEFLGELNNGGCYGVEGAGRSGDLVDSILHGGVALAVELEAADVVNAENVGIFLHLAGPGDVAVCHSRTCYAQGVCGGNVVLFCLGHIQVELHHFERGCTLRRIDGGKLGAGPYELGVALRSLVEEGDVCINELYVIVFVGLSVVGDGESLGERGVGLVDSTEIKATHHICGEGDVLSELSAVALEGKITAGNVKAALVAVVGNLVGLVEVHRLDVVNVYGKVSGIRVGACGVAHGKGKIGCRRCRAEAFDGYAGIRKRHGVGGAVVSGDPKSALARVEGIADQIVGCVLQHDHSGDHGNLELYGLFLVLDGYRLLTELILVEAGDGDSLGIQRELGSFVTLLDHQHSAGKVKLLAEHVLKLRHRILFKGNLDFIAAGYHSKCRQGKK